ncbi:hypothetical protein CN918_25670 [Priestia megaterium]|nr:hypothetical protein CN918_25670 [Priestia megaterium]
MKISVFMTKEEVFAWLNGQEIEVNNVAVEKCKDSEQNEIKIQCTIDEKEVISIRQEHRYPDQTTFYWFTIKRESTPRARYI